jgi:histidinol-phosphate aminotransferase
MTRPRLRAVFDRLASYRPDRAVVPVDGHICALGANESPHEVLPEIAAAVLAVAGTVNRYPDFGATELIAEIARANGVPEDRVALGAGSVALLQMALQAIAEPAAEVLYAWRSFELYPVLAELAGVRSVRVPLVNEVHDLPAMAAAITRHTGMIILCNPNNPTGTTFGHAELREFLEQVPPDCLVVLDEAYGEYVRRPGARSGLSLCRDWPNLVVTRTFSKAYGLAGLRVGYLIGDPYVVAQLRKACPPYSLNVVAQAAALAALKARDQLLAQVDETVAERTRVRAALLAAGWDVPSSEANFLWLRLGEASAAFAARCADSGIHVRTFPGEGVRVSVGSPADNDAFVVVALGWSVGGRRPVGSPEVALG